MKAFSSEKTRHIVLRGEAGDVLPDALTKALYEREVACGYVRANGVLREVELRAFDADLGAPSEARRIAGPVQVLSIEGSIGLARGEVTVGMRAVLARETDRGLETIGGEIVSARIVALEAAVTAFDDLALGRAIDAEAGVWMLGEASAAKFRASEQDDAPAPKATVPSAGWAEAIAASADVEPARGARNVGTGGAIIPRRPARPDVDDESPTPEAGDAVEHFAFGRADVLKSDGERLHLKVHKDGRIREIALEMLKVTSLESNGPHRRFKLDRKM